MFLAEALFIAISPPFHPMKKVTIPPNTLPIVATTTGMNIKLFCLIILAKNISEETGKKVAATKLQKNNIRYW